MAAASRSNAHSFSGSPRATLRFVAPVLISLAAMLIGAVVSVEVLSTMRAFVGGEGLYSKGQKNAVYYLAQYAASGSEADFSQYRSAIAYPLGDRQARLALERRPVDVAGARKGFLQGGNAPADIESVIVLIRMFGGIGPFRQAIEIWTEGDEFTVRLQALASRLHRSDGTPLAAQDRAAIGAELNAINVELTPLEARFSSTLAQVARLTRDWLVLALAAGTLITAMLCIYVTRARVRERDIKERGLARLTELYAALSQTSQLLSRVTDRRQLFDELCRICVGTSGLNLAAVGLLARDRSSIEFLAANGEHQQRLQSLCVLPADGATGQCDPLHAPLYTARPTVFNGPQRPRGPFPSEASFPLTCQNAVVGVLCVFSEEERYFRVDILELMERLAMEASFALESLQREAERRLQASILADQNRILNLIAAGEDLKVIFTMLARFLETQAPGNLCALVALESTGSRLGLGVAPSLPQGFCAALTDSGATRNSAPGVEAIRTRAPVVVQDLDALPSGEPLRQLVGLASLQSASAWPILGSKGQVLGALSLYRRRGDDPQTPNAQLIGICTNLAGIAIESSRAADRIRHLAHHDDLTGLPNRLLFSYQLPQALARAQRTGGAVSVFFLDLDRFKIINDTLGHDAGDAVLRQMAGHLRECVRACDTLARVGGDEFTLLVDQFSDTHELGVIAQKLLAAMSNPLVVNGHEYRLSGSIGVAIYPKDGADGSALLKNADIAMYRAKASGKNNYQFYSSEINVHSVERLALENDLRQAVERGEFEVHYQPKIDIDSGAIAGAEALVRWRHPQRGMLLPSEFIVVAEEVGLIGELGTCVLEAVCSDVVRWRREGLPPTRVAINLSAQQFSDSRLLDNLNRVLRESGCDPQQLEFEITESVVMTSPDRALRLLEHIKNYGITLAIDDFGTGHSSLGYLKRFPVDSVKIDYTFVRDIAADPNDLAIIRAIIALGHSLELKVVAEGVESVTQLEILRRLQCDEFQGFLFSGAIPAARFATMLRTQAPRRRAEAGVLPLAAAR